jgi:hypothetical protein
MPTRLGSIDAELAALLDGAPLQKRRSVAILASMRAISAAGVSEPVAETALAVARGERVGTSDLDEGRSLKELESLRERLDDEYLSLQEKREDDSDTAFLMKFKQARAVASVVFALKQEEQESVYEALSAVSDEGALADEVRQALRA